MTSPSVSVNQLLQFSERLKAASIQRDAFRCRTAEDQLILQRLEFWDDLYSMVREKNQQQPHGYQVKQRTENLWDHHRSTYHHLRNSLSSYNFMRMSRGCFECITAATQCLVEYCSFNCQGKACSSNRCQKVCDSVLSECVVPALFPRLVRFMHF